MAEEEKIEKMDKGKLPLIYRLILKLPKLGLDSLTDYSHGIFWAIIIPIFLIIELFLSLFLLVSLPFPVNITLVSIIPVVILVIFVRIMLERFINWWDATFGEPFEWDVKKATDEYIALLQKQKSKKNEN